MMQAVLVLGIAGFAVTGCNNRSSDVVMPPAMLPDITFYALSDNNQLVKYTAKTADAPDPAISLTGLPTGEKIMSIDFRPATGQLYGLGSSSRLYLLNIKNGNTTALGTTAFTPAVSSAGASIDFNPTVDRIRLVTDKGQNLRLHPETGVTAATDGTINGGNMPAISAIAYTNSVAGAATTELFDIDVVSKKLYKQNPPNDGSLQEVGPLNVNFSGTAGFDISSDNSIALAVLKENSVNKLHSINTSTGAAQFLTTLQGNILDIAIPTPPVAYAISETGMFQIFNPTQANTVISKNITGTGAGEEWMGIDFRPVNGQLYGITLSAAGNARLYTFNLSTGAAAAVGAGFSLAANTSAAGFDFNPTVDRIRLVTNTGQNLRLNPNDGSIAATDLNLNPGSPSIAGAAYTNNFPGATTTVLYVLDMTKLYRQEPPNNGTLIDVGPLNITASQQNGFDIGGNSNKAYALFSVGDATKLYNINISSVSSEPAIDYPNKVRAFSIGLGF
jgi:hypothetical protein